MIFMPYAAELDLYRFPGVTVLICLLCVGIYYAQDNNQGAVFVETEIFCERQQPRMYRMVMKKVMGEVSERACAHLMLSTHFAKDREEHVTNIAKDAGKFAGLSKETSQEYAKTLIEEQYQAYERYIPDDLTEKLWYEPQSWNPWKMITATVSHGSWWHVMGNLYFFFAFAVTVELIIGWWRYLLSILVIGLATGVAYSLSNLGVEDALPTVGLSGVVMGMMALFTYFMPTAGIRCIFWFMIWFKRFVIPAWVLFLWFFGWDVFYLSGEGRPGVNVMAHVSGGVVGFVMGFLVFRKQKQNLSTMVLAGYKGR